MYTLRTSVAEDADFAYEAVKITMRDYAIETWGRWLEKESKETAIEDTQKGKIEIIYFGSEKAGVLQLKNSENEIFVNQIYLLPEYQNKGIGTCIINDLKEIAKKAKVPLKLNVLQVNPAKHFYANRDFKVEKETLERVHMKYVP
jgi:GNAT superfamily N-acetyltransferase